VRAAIENAASAIAPFVRRTPCRRSLAASELSGADVHLKLENLQETGSFKLRGVVNKVLSLTAGQSSRLLVAASTGNHGMAFAHAVGVFGLHGKLFVPRTVSRVKVDLLRRSGIPFEMVGDNCIEAEVHAHEFACTGDHVWISPYNDVEVVHGQGTVGVELLQQLDGVDVVLVPVGGGGLISGIAAYLKAIDPTVQVIGCQPRNSCVMFQSLEAGRIVRAEEAPTIADGTAGGIEDGSVTFDLCRRFVDDFILLDETEIERAICVLYEREGISAEGAAALTVAAVMSSGRRFAGQRVVAVVSGSRLDPAILRRLGCGEYHQVPT
jgi:threonine dehydratase